MTKRTAEILSPLKDRFLIHKAVDLEVELGFRVNKFSETPT